MSVAGAGGVGGLTPPVRVRLAGTDISVWVTDAALACCALECAAALAATTAEPPDSDPPDSGAGDAALSVLVVSGTVTDRVAAWLPRLHAQLPPPVRVLAFGACAISGGPYWDSYAVTAGVEQVLAVDGFIPGCPPTPAALRQALTALLAASQPGPVGQL